MYVSSSNYRMKNLLLIPIIFCITIIGCNEKGESFTTSPIMLEKSIQVGESSSANDILIDQDKMYVLGTSKDSFGLDAMLFLILDVNGNELARHLYSKPNAMQFGKKLIQLKDGNFLLMGNTVTSDNTDILLLKINPTGIVHWEMSYGGSKNEDASDLVELQNNQICVVGNTESYGAGFSDIYTLWLDQNGNIVEEKTYGDVDSDGSAEVLELTSNEIMIYGYTLNYGAVSRDLYLLHLNATGDSVWSKQYGGSEYEESQEFALTSTGEYVLCGHSASTDINHNMYGTKISSNGDVIWEQNFGGTLHDGGEALLIDKEGNYVFVGRSMSYGNGNENAFMVICNEEGDILAETVFGGLSNVRIDAIAESDLSYFLIGQKTENDVNQSHVHLIKMMK